MAKKNPAVLYPATTARLASFEALIAHLCTRPSMWVLGGDFPSVCAYITGFDCARDGGPLSGWREWLVVRCGTGDNCCWGVLAEMQLRLDLVDPVCPEKDRKVFALGQLLAEFFAVRNKDGLTKIFHVYAKWILRKPWYSGPLRNALKTK
jgi:hypothetical protein